MPYLMDANRRSVEQRHDPTWDSQKWEYPGSVSSLEARQHEGIRFGWARDNALLFSQNAAAAMNADEPPNRDAQLTGSGMNLFVRAPDAISSCLRPNSFSPQPMAMLNYSGNRTMASVDATSTFSLSALNPTFTTPALSADPRISAVEQRRLMVGIVGIPDQRTALLHGITRREPEISLEEDCAGLGLDLGVRTYFSNEDTAAGRFIMRRPRLSSTAARVPKCQAQGCTADLANFTRYHRRHKVCPDHSKAASVNANGLIQRFCQQCSRFHVLSEFDDGKRSCRKRLADHNRRRRKPQPFVQKEHHFGATSRAGNPTSTIPSSNGEDLLPSAISLYPSQHGTNATERPLFLPILGDPAHAKLSPHMQHSGTHLSLRAGFGPDDSQTANHPRSSANHSYSSMNQLLSWCLKPGVPSTSDVIGDSLVKHPVNARHAMPDIFYQSPGDMPRVMASSPSIHDAVTIQPASISDSGWLVDRKHLRQFDIHMTEILDHQQPTSLPTSLFDHPTPGRDQRHASRSPAIGISFLHQQPTMNSRHADESHAGSGNQSDMKFVQQQALRSFGSIYDTVHNGP